MKYYYAKGSFGTRVRWQTNCLLIFIPLSSLSFSSYPLMNIPLPGTIPTKIVLPYEGRYTPLFGEKYNQSSGGAGAGGGASTTLPPSAATTPLFEGGTSSGSGGSSSSGSSNDRGSLPWAQSSPALYVQQITLRVSVLPWTDEMQLMDAFRAPLYEVFKLLEIVRNHQSSEK